MEMVEHIKNLIASRAEVSSDLINDDSRFVGDLGIDSFELMNLLSEIEDILGTEINERDIWGLQKFGDIRLFVENVYRIKEGA